MNPLILETRFNRIRAYVHPTVRQEISDPLNRASIICNANRLTNDMVALPDFHYKVGNFIPTGTVTATEADRIIPCAVGNGAGCGYSLLRLGISRNETNEQEIGEFFKSLMRQVAIHPNGNRFDRQFCLDVMNFGLDAVPECAPDEKAAFDYQGNVFSAHPMVCPDRRYDRYLPRENYSSIFTDLQVLGGGNHFIELLAADQIKDPVIAAHFGVKSGDLFINFHSDGINVADMSRTFTPYKTFRNRKRVIEELKKMAFHLKFYHHLFHYLRQDEIFSLPAESRAARQFLSFIFAAANFGFANRLLLARKIMRIAQKSFRSSREAQIFADNVHDLISFENGLWIHRTGATRIAEQEEYMRADYHPYGKPAIIPVALGACSFLGVPGAEVRQTYRSLPHGAGRRIDRSKAAHYSLEDLNAAMDLNSVRLFRHGLMDIAREHPDSFRDEASLSQCLEGFDLVKIFAVLKPIAVLKA